MTLTFCWDLSAADWIAHSDLPWTRLDGVRAEMRPISQPPVWMAANSDAAVRRAARTVVAEGLEALDHACNLGHQARRTEVVEAVVLRAGR